MARTSRPGGGNDSRLLGALVSSPQRRTVMWHLADSGGTARFDDLVDVLDSDPDGTMTAIRLHHIHLPKLQTFGAIEWDSETGVVRLTPRAREAISDATRNELFDRLASD